MKKIKEIVVVEGKNDANKLQEIFKNIDCITTNGSEVSNETINHIKEASIKRGVILFLDPDGPGKKIRAKIEQFVPNCKHAFIEQKDGISYNHKKVGIEHATPEVIINALENVYELSEDNKSITNQELIELGFVGRPNSKELRLEVASKLHIGHPNAKQLLKRLNMFNITKEDLINVLKKQGE